MTDVMHRLYVRPGRSGASREPRVMIMNRGPPAIGDLYAPVILFLRFSYSDVRVFVPVFILDCIYSSWGYQKLRYRSEG